jgi:DNA mismatch repair protein MSH4
MSATSCDVSGQPSRLFVQIRKEVPQTPVVPLQRRLFNEAKGLQRIQHLVVDQFSSVIHTVTQKYYSLSATAALVKYVELVKAVVFTPKSLKIEFQGSEKTVMIGELTL